MGSVDGGDAVDGRANYGRHEMTPGGAGISQGKSYLRWGALIAAGRRVLRVWGKLPTGVNP